MADSVGKRKVQVTKGFQKAMDHERFYERYGEEADDEEPIRNDEEPPRIFL